jgi:hypothetical protein
MSELLAPVDPIFWLHHANVDRLWDVWTRRERQAGRTAMPGEADRWKREPLLFFAGGDAMAERYLEASALGYSYSAGFGDEILQETHPTVAPAPSRAERFEGEKVDAALRTDVEASAAVRVPNALLVAARTPTGGSCPGTAAISCTSRRRAGSSAATRTSRCPSGIGHPPRAFPTRCSMTC